ncbi:MAG: cytochrome-c peroxidase [Flavobacteriaceae bacterium]
MMAILPLIGCSSDDLSQELLDLPNDDRQVNELPNTDNPDEPDSVGISEEELQILRATLDLPSSFFNYSNVPLPDYFLDRNLRQEDNTPGNNPVSDAGATLGRTLFYDTKLSANNTISCASCHVQENSFSDPSRFSMGFEGALTLRNSMSLANARYYSNGRFFWDERARTLEEQVLLPIQDMVEMGMTLTELEEKLSAEDYYKVLFQKAFGDEEVSSERMALALAQFIRSMVSYRSKYDEGLSQTGNNRDEFPNFTPSENLGKTLFFSNRTNCAQCHTTNAFVGAGPRNIGLDVVFTDLGVGGITNRANEIGEFKVSSLRNIALTAPYMHDGRFTSLEQVIEHYNSGIQDNISLDDRLRQNNGQVLRLNLSDLEKRALRDFLLTLTDPIFISDEKFSNPFIASQ